MRLIIVLLIIGLGSGALIGQDITDLENIPVEYGKVRKGLGYLNRKTGEILSPDKIMDYANSSLITIYKDSTIITTDDTIHVKKYYQDKATGKNYIHKTDFIGERFEENNDTEYLEYDGDKLMPLIIEILESQQAQIDSLKRLK